MKSPKSVRSFVPGYTPELGDRIKSVISRIGGLQEAAKISGVTDEQVARWRDGVSKPPFFAISSLCRHAGVSLTWLATGEFDQEPSVRGFSEDQAPYVAGPIGPDPELFGRIVDRIARVYRDEGVRLSDIDLGRLAAEKYGEIASLAADPDEWPGFLEVVASRVRKAIRAAAADPAHVKRGA